MPRTRAVLRFEGGRRPKGTGQAAPDHRRHRRVYLYATTPAPLVKSGWQAVHRIDGASAVAHQKGWRRLDDAPNLQDGADTLSSVRISLMVSGDFTRW